MTATLTFFIAALLCLQDAVEYRNAAPRVPMDRDRPDGRPAAAAPVGVAHRHTGFRTLFRRQYARSGGSLFPGPGPWAAGVLDRGTGALCRHYDPEAYPGRDAGRPPPSLRMLLLGPVEPDGPA